MDVRRQRLENGLRVAAIPVPGLLSAAVLLAIEAGQWFEPLGRPGIGRLCALTMHRGTTPRDAKTWADALDGIGDAARLDVGSHASTFSAQSLGSDLDVLLELMADAVMHPAFAASEVELVRQQTVAQIEEDARNTRAVAESAWRELVYPQGHPFRARPIGDVDVVRAASADDLREHHRRASRAGHVVRDELGLAYYVFSTIGGSLGQSPWVVRMGVNPINVERAVSTTLEELRKIVDGKIAEDDLELAQDKMVGELDVARESPAGVASLHLEGEVFNLGPDYAERYPRELRAVTLEQVVEIARTFLPPERYALAIAGPPLPERD